MKKLTLVSCEGHLFTNSQEMIFQDLNNFMFLQNKQVWNITQMLLWNEMNAKAIEDLFAISNLSHTLKRNCSKCIFYTKSRFKSFSGKILSEVDSYVEDVPSCGFRALSLLPLDYEDR